MRAEGGWRYAELLAYVACWIIAILNTFLVFSSGEDRTARLALGLAAIVWIRLEHLKWSKT